LRRRVKGDLKVEFSEQGLTSYAGLELFGRYLRWIGLNGRIRHHLREVLRVGDYGAVALCRVILGLLIVGGRRPHHIGFAQGDPLFGRFCGLWSLPSDTTLSRWLKRFRSHTVEALRRLNAELIGHVVGLHLAARTLTIDVDGTVLSTGLKVAWAFRGYNPHHRKVPSYFPISAYLADSGHVLRLNNRPGNVNDGAASVTFLRQLFQQISQTLGRRKLRFRMDGDFFKKPVVALLQSKCAGYAIKVPFWRCLDLQTRIRARRHWKKVDEDVQGFFTTISVKTWDRQFRVAIFRKQVHHPTQKNYQLDLFDPNNGTWEYSAVASNLTLGMPALWRFMCGRGVHEKVIGELKSGLALDTIPTNHYGANSAWQQFVVLAHNLLVNFQIETGTVRRPRNQKATAHWVLKRIRRLRFELINRAGRLVRPHGSLILKLLENEKSKNEFLRIASALTKAA
jgi:hypothetical protein